nr:MAG TPA: hypothetical protein [Caudoviricetes sp.]
MGRLLQASCSTRCLRYQSKGVRRLRRISITDGARTVELMPDLRFTIAPETVAVEATMASGKTVMDKIGVKDVLEIPTGWLSVDDLAKLRAMIKASPALTVSYPTVGGDKTDVFIVDQPECKSFSYGDDGVTQWYGVTLTMRQQGVDK